MQGRQTEEEYVVLEEGEETKNTNFGFKIEAFLESKAFLVVVFALVSLTAFFLGRVSASRGEKMPVRVHNSSPNPSLNLREGRFAPSDFIENSASVVESLPNITAEVVVGSKNGTKYHYPWCAGAKQIAEKNLIKFGSIEEARAKGYTPAANCKGLR